MGSAAADSLVSVEMRGVLGKTLRSRSSYPVSASDIRKWALAVYYPSSPRQVQDRRIGPEAAGAEQLGAPGQNGLGMIRSKMLEMSNVRIVDEMVGLIVAQRAYEVNSKAIQTADEMLSIANNLRR